MSSPVPEQTDEQILSNPETIFDIGVFIDEAIPGWAKDLYAAVAARKAMSVAYKSRPYAYLDEIRRVRDLIRKYPGRWPNIFDPKRLPL